MSDGHNDPFHHVRDVTYFEMPQFVYHYIPKSYFQLPVIDLWFFQVPITKYMVLQVVALVLALLIFGGLARRIRNGKPVKGYWWNFWEALALFVRDEVVRPSIGDPHHHHHGDAHGHHDDAHGALQLASATGGLQAPGGIDLGHDSGAAGFSPAVPTGYHYADRFLPFIWSLFFYILFCNLLGAVPLLGAATASTSVTAVLAASVLAMTIYAGTQQSGAAGFWKSLVPSMDVPGVMGQVLIPMIWVIEVIGLFIKHAVLAIRLFANMLAGHVVIGVLLSFIASTATMGPLWYAVTPASILGQLAVGALELFVAFLQAYVFSLLAAMFIGSAVNPH